uniref:Envelope glycoprotein n=1 Tax=Pseudonaja textilis TaxID=8673 RepID=A0A670ZBY4_PSETE
MAFLWFLILRMAFLAVIISETRDLGDNLWKENSYIKDIRIAAKGLNVTNCWLCMHRTSTKLSTYNDFNHWIDWGPDPKKWDQTLFTTKVTFTTKASVCYYRPPVGTQSILLGNTTLCQKVIPLEGGCMKCVKSNTSQNSCINRISSTLSRALKGPYDCCINQTVTKRPDIGNGAYVLCTWMWLMWSWESEASDNTYHKHLKYFPLPDGLWLLCGDAAYQQWPKNWSGVCTIGFVIPVIYKLEGLPIGMRIRNRREVDSGLTIGGNLWTQISRAAIPPLGIAMNYRDIHILNNFTVAMFNNTIRSIKMLNEEVSEIRQVTLQNRYALDIMLAAKGGVCALIHSHCCVFIHNYEPNITRTVHDMEDRIAEHEAGKDGFNKSLWALFSWLLLGDWILLHHFI